MAFRGLLKTGGLLNKIAAQAGVQPTTVKYTMAFRGPLRTGGLINKIAAQAGVHQACKTVNTMAIAHRHKISEEKKMLEALEAHRSGRCDVCGQHANGGLKEWTDNLHAAVQRLQAVQLGAELGAIDREDCKAFMYDLFVRSPIRGVYMEDMALAHLNADLQELSEGRPATAEEDTKFAIDIVFPGVAVQVKPISFYYYSCKNPTPMRQCRERNAKWGQGPVSYLYYDQYLKWTNYPEVRAAVETELRIMAGE